MDSRKKNYQITSKESSEEDLSESDIKKTPTRDRILNISRDLFLSQGYSETGLNQIVDEANTVKASLYQHFKSKEELGRIVIRNYANQNLQLLQELMNRYPHPSDFVKAWVRILKREAKHSSLHGCGMANFRAQISNREKGIAEEIQSITAHTILEIVKYLSTAQKEGLLNSKQNPKKLGRLLFIAYEGVLIGYRLTGDPKVLEDLIEISQKLFIDDIMN
jgi:AcrR family transcriptional regulator